jgi:hypothetical protein
MLKKIIVTAALLAAGMSCAQAVATKTTVTPTVVAPVAAAPAAESLHQTRDAILRGCKVAADKKQLTGIARTAEIDNCVKTTPR